MKTLLLSTLLAVLTTACVTADPDAIVITDQDDGAAPIADGGKSDAVSEFHVLDVELPYDALEDRAFIVFASRRAFMDAYGLTRRVEIDFRSQWIFVYQAGSQPTGGYLPGILDITRQSNRIRFHTQLATPGNGCFTSQGETRPYVVVAFRKPTRPAAATFSVSHGQIENVCEPTSCELVDCLEHLICDDSSGVAQCVPVEEPVSCAAVLCQTQTYCDESTGTAQCLPLVCPPSGTTFNCKLPLTPERGPSCNPSFQAWVGGHCPGVTFAL